MPVFTLRKSKYQMNQNVKVKNKILKFAEDNIGEYLSDLKVEEMIWKIKHRSYKSH